ncbi:hypothetical protein [Shewanella psychrotolerans]|uniref:hypothetical protein n=1 Tax=Shewanella psychrotolerans TaxID=2864206 RepID=UPI001C655266|nr:hypothetical protein [Shewanella psychrotolerans]QYK02426.1 hypothetical protein K0I62_05595 [Shewanella psychrotolerans]
MSKSAAFHHLLKHFRSNKQSLAQEIQILIDNDNLIDNTNLVNIAKYSGALDCLYWQALGNDLTTLAKGIRRTLDRARTYHGFEAI